METVFTPHKTNTEHPLVGTPSGHTLRTARRVHVRAPRILKCRANWPRQEETPPFSGRRESVRVPAEDVPAATRHAPAASRAGGRRASRVARPRRAGGRAESCGRWVWGVGGRDRGRKCYLGRVI